MAHIVTHQRDSLNSCMYNYDLESPKSGRYRPVYCIKFNIPNDRHCNPSTLSVVQDPPGIHCV